MNIQKRLLDSRWEVNVLGRSPQAGIEGETITLAHFPTEEEAQMHKRVLEINGGGG